MALNRLSSKDYAKAVGAGIATAAILSMIMVPAFKAGISHMPKPLGLAFAQVLLGAAPLAVGLLFHLAYVTFWSVAYVVLFPRRSFLEALCLALALWGLVLVVFFPVVGWGFLGLAVSPKLIVAALLPHLLFAFVLWGMIRWLFPSRAGAGAGARA